MNQPSEKEEKYIKILFGTCLTEHCDHNFNFALNLVIEYDAKLWIYHGLGRFDLSDEETIEMRRKKQSIQPKVLKK